MSYKGYVSKINVSGGGSKVSGLKVGWWGSPGHLDGRCGSMV